MSGGSEGGRGKGKGVLIKHCFVDYYFFCTAPVTLLCSVNDNQ